MLEITKIIRRAAVKTFIKKLKTLNEAAATISGVLIFLICLLAVVEVIARTVFDQPTRWSLAFSQFMLLYAIFLGSAYCFQERGHIRVDILVEHLPRRMRASFNVIGLLIASVFVGVLIWKGYENMILSARFDFLTITTIQIPAAYLYAIIFVGSILMLLSIFALISENILIFMQKEEGDVE